MRGTGFVLIVTFIVALLVSGSFAVAAFAAPIIAFMTWLTTRGDD